MWTIAAYYGATLSALVVLYLWMDDRPRPEPLRVSCILALVQAGLAGVCYTIFTIDEFVVWNNCGLAPLGVLGAPVLAAIDLARLGALIIRRWRGGAPVMKVWGFLGVRLAAGYYAMVISLVPMTLCTA